MRPTVKETSARGMILRMLQHGPRKETDVFASAMAHRIPRVALEAAKRSLNITVDGGMWRLPYNLVAMFPRTVRRTVLAKVRLRKEG